MLRGRAQRGPVLYQTQYPSPYSHFPSDSKVKTLAGREPGTRSTLEKTECHNTSRNLRDPLQCCYGSISKPSTRSPHCETPQVNPPESTSISCSTALLSCRYLSMRLGSSHPSEACLLVRLGLVIPALLPHPEIFIVHILRAEVLLINRGLLVAPLSLSTT